MLYETVGIGKCETPHRVGVSMTVSSADAEAVSGAFPYSFAYLPNGGRRALVCLREPPVRPVVLLRSVI